MCLYYDNVETSNEPRANCHGGEMTVHRVFPDLTSGHVDRTPMVLQRGSRAAAGHEPWTGSRMTVMDE